MPYSRGDLLSRVHELGACDTEEHTDAGTLIQVTGVGSAEIGYMLCCSVLPDRFQRCLGRCFCAAAYRGAP